MPKVQWNMPHSKIIYKGFRLKNTILVLALARSLLNQSLMNGSTCLSSSPPMTRFAQHCTWRGSHPPHHAEQGSGVTADWKLDMLHHQAFLLLPQH